jgi:predicted dehydrogenase
VRALIVGYGSIARRHLENLRATAAVREFVVVRPGGRPPGADAELRFVSAVSEGVVARPDLAVVASPSAAHIEALLPLLEAGIPCYVEKPAVTEPGDVARLRALRQLPVTMSGCNLRFLPSLRRLRDAVRSGSIGTPVRASLQAGQWLPDWRPQRDYRTTYSARAAAGGGVIFDLIHEIDAARWLFGEFDQVHALSGKLSSLEIEAVDSAAILLGRRRGPLVAIGLDYVARPPIRRYEVFGDEGTLAWDLAARRLTRANEVLAADPADFDVAATYRAAMNEFVAAVGSGAPTSQDLRDGLASAELALRAR